MLKPFLIWPGGKRRLIPELKDRLPESFGKKITKYVEPFVGGGALMFHIRRLDKRGVKFLVSNSEPDNDYFDRLYSGFNIDRVPIYRSICAESDKRKVVNELMIYNYDRVNTYLFNKGV
jgi:site-specific DNA-adenine methylase